MYNDAFMTQKHVEQQSIDGGISEQRNSYKVMRRLSESIGLKLFMLFGTSFNPQKVTSVGASVSLF